jgi:hypothetical protein
MQIHDLFCKTVAVVDRLKKRDYLNFAPCLLAFMMGNK